MATSQAQITANQANAQKSTGPTSDEGKKIASRNSYKHGFCAKPGFVPHEDPDVYHKRLDDFQTQLNPKGGAFQAWWVETVVHVTIIVDRLVKAKHSRYIRRSKKAQQTRQERNACRVERLTRMLDTAPDTAVRQLKQFPEGCDYLISLWVSLHKTALDREWDFGSLANLHTLAGDLLIGDRVIKNLCVTPADCAKLDFMSPYWTDTDTLLSLNVVRNRLSETTNQANWAMMSKHYNNKIDLRKEDEAALIQLEAAVKLASPRLAAFCQSQIDAVTLLRDQLIKDDAALGETDEMADLREAFDHSPKGLLLHRYLHENLRGLSRATAELAKLNSWTLLAVQGVDVSLQHDMAEGVRKPKDIVQPWIKTEVVSRNEPNSGMSPEAKSMARELREMGREMKKGPNDRQ